MPTLSRPADHVRPYGDGAPWNVAADTLATHPQSDSLVDKLWNDAPAARPGNFNLGFDDYTYPVYYAADATGMYTVDTVSWANLDGEKMPWNPAWTPAPGSDGQVIVLDAETGKEWNLWQVSFDGDVISASNGNLVPGNYFTKVDGFDPSRGVGIQYYAMLVQPEEIAAGEIAHALSMPIRNTAAQFVAPGTKSDGHTANGIPMGTRFELTVTDAEIDAWIDSLPDQLPASTLSSARVIAEALNDYGWFITDTAGGATWQFEARTTAGDLWTSLGLGATSVEWRNYPSDLMDGLLAPDRIRAIVPSDEYGSVPPPQSSDTAAPTAALVGGSDITAETAAVQTLVVRYADNVAIDISSLDGNDIDVSGPAGTQSASLSSIDINSDGTPRTATYTLAAPGGTWDASDNGTYTIALQGNEVEDTSGNGAAGGTLGTFAVAIASAPPQSSDTAAPTAALVGGSDITAETAAVQTLVVRYADNVAIDISSLDGNDIDVSGPAGTQSASLSSIDINSDGTPRTATYTLAAPGGTWDASDNGTYTIALQGNEVEDTSGNGAAGGTLGTFAVAIASAPPQSGPVDLVAASGQFDVVEDPLAAGQDFDVQFAIENDGTGTAGTFDVDFFLSTNSWISANDHYLGSRTIDSVAGNGTSGTLTETLTLPTADDGFWRGDDTYYVGMLIDDADAIDETNESNNYRTGQGNDRDSVFVSLSSPPPPQSSDTAAPTAALVGGSDITAETAAVQTLVVRYADNVAIDISSLDGNDIDVSGPAGTQSASLSSIDINSDGTPRTATYTLAAPGGTWDASDNGTYTIALQGNEVEDTSGNGAAGGTLGTFAVAIASAPPQSSDTAAPTAALVGGSDITAETAAVQTLVVRYADNVAIDISSLDGNDIDVSGPAGTQSASLSSIDINSDGTPRTATYTLAAPGGTWDASDNGTYTIALQGNEVEDTSGNGAAGGTLGTFAVAIASAPPQSGPVDLVAASGQFDVVEDPLAAGQDFDVQFAIENDGTGTAGTFDVDFFLSTNSWISANDHYLGSRTIDSVAGNGTSGTLTETLTLPTADDGFWRGDDTYYVGMLIDDADAIDETNESNNYRTGQGNDRDSVFVSLSSPPPPQSSDTAAPTAALVGGSDITAETAAVQTLVVRYADNVAIDISSLDGNDIDVSGPAGTQSASLSSIDINSDGTPRTATYTLAAPGGTWDASDNGTYTIALQGNEVEDTSGNGAAGGTLGTFAVAIASAPPQSGPVDLVAASGQFDVVEDPLAAGQDFDVQFAIENDGTGTAGTFDVDFFLSTNSWISANDHYLGSRTIDSVAGNGTSGTLTETLTLPTADDGFWRGDDTYYVGMLIDDADAIDETNESNNYRTGQGNDYDSVFVA